jgi:hypothetical protein
MALRSADLLAQLRARNASAAAAGLSEAHGDADDAEQVTHHGAALQLADSSEPAVLVWAQRRGLASAGALWKRQLPTQCAVS